MNVNEHNLAVLEETRQVKPLCAIFTNQILSVEVLSKCSHGYIFADAFCYRFPVLDLDF